MLQIREENPTDYRAVKDVNDLAFNQTTEGEIIEKIRILDPNALSLVAEINSKIVGHIFFSSVEVEGQPEIINAMGLAPMAVLPEYQKQGIGKRLVLSGIEILKEKDVPFIIVLGHDRYYPKFGFEKASKYGIKCQWEGIPDEAFMILILDMKNVRNYKGLAKYREEWNEAI